MVSPLTRKHGLICQYVFQMNLFLDQSASRIVSYYKSMIIILFKRFFEELEDLKESISKTGIIDNASIEDFQGEIYTPGIEQLNITAKADFLKIQVK